MSGWMEKRWVGRGGSWLLLSCWTNLGTGLHGVEGGDSYLKKKNDLFIWLHQVACLNFISLFSTALGLNRCEWAFLVVLSRGVSCCGAWALGSRASAVVAQGLHSCDACEIFPAQRSNPDPLCWQADSYPPDHQGSPAPGFSRNTQDL